MSHCEHVKFFKFSLFFAEGLIESYQNCAQGPRVQDCKTVGHDVSVSSHVSVVTEVMCNMEEALWGVTLCWASSSVRFGGP
jgi:hypothetical protein